MRDCRRFNCQTATSLTATLPRSRRASTRVLLTNVLPSKSEGAGNAGRPPRPRPRVQKYKKHTSIVTTVTPEIARHSPRNGFNGFLRALPGVRILGCHRHRRIRFCQTWSGRLASADLAPATGARTTRLRRPLKRRSSRVPFVSSRAFDPPCHPLTSPGAAASTASRLASVTIASRPSVRRDGRGYRFDLGKARSGIFLQTGLDRQIGDLPVRQNQQAEGSIRAAITVFLDKASNCEARSKGRDVGEGSLSCILMTPELGCALAVPFLSSLPQGVLSSWSYR